MSTEHRPAPACDVAGLDTATLRNLHRYFRFTYAQRRRSHADPHFSIKVCDSGLFFHPGQVWGIFNTDNCLNNVLVTFILFWDGLLTIKMFRECVCTRHMCHVVLSRYLRWNDTHRTPLFSGAWCYQGRNTKPLQGSCPLSTSGGVAAEPFNAKCSAVGIWHCCGSDNLLGVIGSVKMILFHRNHSAPCIISHKVPFCLTECVAWYNTFRRKVCN